MVSFRPHRLILKKSKGGSYDSSGDWTEGTIDYTCCIPCRYEPNGSARTITLQDGKEYKYSYMVYLSVNPSLVIEYGDIIELISQDCKSIGEYEVKGFHRGQLDMKIWV